MRSLHLFLIIIVICILLLFNIYKVKNNVSILLTTTVNIKKDMKFIFQNNTNERLDQYIKTIKQWLTKTDYKVVVVENSGYTFEELNREKQLYKDRFEVITFNEETAKGAEYLKAIKNKGDHEVFAINYAYTHSTMLRTSDHIIKVTGRYFIPGLESYLSRIHLEPYMAIRQMNIHRCELIGSRKDVFTTLFNLEMLDKTGKYNPHAEDVYTHRMHNLIDQQKVLVLPSFTIERTQRGGVNEKFNDI